MEFSSDDIELKEVPPGSCLRGEGGVRRTLGH